MSFHVATNARGRVHYLAHARTSLQMTPEAAPPPLAFLYEWSDLKSAASFPTEAAAQKIAADVGGIVVPLDSGRGRRA